MNERLERCKKWQERLNSDYADIKSHRELSVKYRDADPSIVEVLKGRSKVTTTDMQDAIDLAKPDILETIAGVDEPLKLDPDEAKYVDAVKKLQVLGNVMVKRKNNWYRICSDFLDDSMVLKFGCIKYSWIEKESETEKIYKDLQDMEIQGFLARDGAKLVSDDRVDGKGETKIKYAVTDEYVKYSGVPSERIKFPLDTRSFDNCPIVIEEVSLYEHEFIETYGEEFFKKIKETKEALDKTDADDEFAARFKHLGGLNYVWDKKGDKYKAYEAYFYKGTEPWVMIYGGDDAIHTDEKNKYGKPPYRGGSAFLMAHSLIGKDYLDHLQRIQEERTYFKRQITDIVSQSAFRRNFVNIDQSGMNIDDYENNSAMNALVRCSGDISDNSIRPEVKPPLPPEMLNYWELLNIEKDNHVPTPRAFAGLEGSKDERTYRGKQLKVNQASKKLLMMMRNYMEEVFGPLFQDTLDCIAKFMSKKTVVRYLNEDYDISPEDVICKYALVVNVGLGSQDKQDMVVKLQQLIQLSMQGMQTGIVTPQNLFFMYQELVRAMGFLNTMDFVTDPKLKDTVMQFIQMVMAMIQQFASVPQLNPEIQQIGTHLMQMAHTVLSALGVQEQPNGGGTNTQGTQPGQEPAALPENPANTMNPQAQITGGGFYA